MARTLAEEILAYLDSHPHAVDSAEGIATWWLEGQRYEASRVERELDRLADDGLIERIRLADDSVVYGRREALH